MNDRFKFRVWCKSDKKYNEYKSYILFEDGELGEYDSSSPVQEWYIVEQCTGLKDKNGKLIYEGDYIKDRFTSVYIIKWIDAKFMAVDIAEIQPDNSPNQKWLDWNEFEIIGNIHEQVEQKE